MSNSKIPTAKLILTGKETYDSEYPTVSKYDALEAMIEFAKLHVTKALTSAHINMQLPIEDLEFTLNSYPLTNIK